MPNAYQPHLAILGRLLLAAIFLISPLVNLIPNFGATAMAMGNAGIPFPTLALAIAIAMLLAGSVSMIAGYRARWGALLLLLFLLPATYYFHAPWKANDAAEVAAQAVHFLKNIGLMGAMLMIIVLGSGPGSFEGRGQ